jgi:hypothetical protein
LNFRSAGVARPSGVWGNNLSTIQPKMINPGVQAGIKQRKGELLRKKIKKIHFFMNTCPICELSHGMLTPKMYHSILKSLYKRGGG